MKSILKNIAFYSLALFLTSQLLSGLKVSDGSVTYILGGVVLTLLFMIVKPILSIVTLPLTIITLGWFSWVINALILYLLTIVVTNISISAFMFKGLAFAGFVVPGFYVNNFFAFIAISAILTLVVGVLRWLTGK